MQNIILGGGGSLLRRRMMSIPKGSGGAYTPLTYLQTKPTGDQYIVLGCTLADSDEIVVVSSLLSGTREASILGWSGGTNNSEIYYESMSVKTFGSLWPIEDRTLPSGITYGLPDTTYAKAVRYIPNMYLCCYRVGQYKFYGRIYSLRIYRSGALIYEYLPYLRKADGKPGMYETVSGTFLTNAGDSDFDYA